MHTLFSTIPSSLLFSNCLTEFTSREPDQNNYLAEKDDGLKQEKKMLLLPKEFSV